MEFPEVFATALVIVLPTFVHIFRERINVALVFVAILISLALATLSGKQPPNINPLSIVAGVVWQLVGVLQKQ